MSQPIRCVPVIVLLAVASAACSEPAPPPASEPSPAAVVSEATETLALETDEHRLRMLSTDSRPRHTVEGLDGRVLALAICEAALAHDYPHLSELAQSGADGVHFGIGHY
jgi:hypothetical protein